jgi:prolipoprotein diacylglyceryltransferase
MELDLSGLVVLTEAATRNYVYTTIIAAMAGARIVYGLTQNSNYGSVQEVTK